MPHPVFRKLEGSVACFVLMLAFGAAAAKGLSGSFVGDSPNGPVELELEQSGDGLTVVLTDAGARFEL